MTNENLANAIAHLAALLESGRTELAAAEAAAQRARFPLEAEPARLHGIALFQLGRINNARDALQTARALTPQSIEVSCNLGSVLLASGDPAGAVAVLEQALALAPAHPAALNGLGNARRASGDLAGAREAYAYAARAMPDYIGAWLNLAAIELESGAPEAAAHAVRHALALAPQRPEALLLLGHVLAAQRRYSDAYATYAAGARCAPDDARFPYQCGLMAEEQKQFALAAKAHARALALDPNLHHALGQLLFLRRQLCDWRELDLLSSRLRAHVAEGAPGIAPFGFLAEPATAAEQLRCAQTCAAGIDRKVASLRNRLAFVHAPTPASAPLRVGFVASGFGNHPTASLVVAAIEALRNQAIEIHLFSTTPHDGSNLLQRLRAAAHVWHDAAGTTASLLAGSIHAVGAEILIDLDGYCSGAMPEAFALRPAPLQVNWLAYPGTLGAAWTDYVIADRVVLPDTLRAGFSEQVAWLPRCFQPSDSTRVVGMPPSRAQCGLPETGVVYVCFNNHYKINPASFVRMLDVLQAAPDSVLWLLSSADGADARLCTEARHAGVDPARLVFMPKLAHADYLARYRHADLFLDTAPYNAHTTASDAIFAGCPVLTVAGETFASRVAASLNHHLGMPHLNATDDAAFIEIAKRVGREPGQRAALRAELAEHRQRSGLFDMDAFAIDFATLLRRMSQRHRAGLAPAALD